MRVNCGWEDKPVSVLSVPVRVWPPLPKASGTRQVAPKLASMRTGLTPIIRLMTATPDSAACLRNSDSTFRAAVCKPIDARPARPGATGVQPGIGT